MRAISCLSCSSLTAEMVARGYQSLTGGVPVEGHGSRDGRRRFRADWAARSVRRKRPGSGRDARPQGDDKDAGAVRRAADQGGPPRRDAEDRRDLRHPAALDLDGEPDYVSPNVEQLDLQLPSAGQGEALAE